ncbi:MAG: MIP/aquaporin family protein [Brevinema sp.]
MSVELIAEILGTAILILVGNGVVSNVVLNRTKGHNSGWIVITAGWAFAVLIAIIITGRVSGAHLNPAVTIANIVNGSMDLSLGLSYIGSQMIGAILGACLVWLSYKNHFEATEDQGSILACFATGPAIRNLPLNFFCECLATCVFLLAIFGINHPDAGFGSLGAVLVSSSIWGLGLGLGGTTGYALNPARDLGPRIAHAFLPIKGKGQSDWAYSWVPVAGPILGAVLAVYIYQLII